MKTKIGLLMLAFLIAIANLNAQNTTETENDAELLGLPGDNLDLYATLDLFQKSKTIEEFEKSLNAEELLGYTIFITMFFYLFSHVIVAFYFKTMNVKTYLFPKELHEKDLDMFVYEIKKREQIIDNVVSMTDALSELNHQDEEKSGAKKWYPMPMNKS